MVGQVHLERATSIRRNAAIASGVMCDFWRRPKGVRFVLMVASHVRGLAGGLQASPARRRDPAYAPP